MNTNTLHWIRRNLLLLGAGAFALCGILVGAVLSVNQAAASVAGGATGSRPTYAADQVPADAPTSGEELPYVVVPDASGESAVGSARVNPTGGTGSLNVWFDGSNVQLTFSGNCGPNAYLSSIGHATVTISGDASGMWSTGTLCLPSSRTNSMSTPISNASCWRDTSATVQVSGTPFHDGSYTVALTGTNRPCPGEWAQWDWSTNSLATPSQAPSQPTGPDLTPNVGPPPVDPNAPAPSTPSPSSTP